MPDPGTGAPARARIEVVAAVVFNERGQFLLAQRPAGKVYAGYWEFPGGKVEPGEDAATALKR
ncbi:MAG TPA: NUDIX domain-containing protein, partial [Burkholderiales bacterium]|nr:NUDIX domain-containing protein [Burkholderiales bacterium]